MDLITRFADIRPPAPPEDVANLIVYILSDATPSMHGNIISADGITAG
jgi:enoyl-[acyl-carrier-protein] reductase (NADH)